MKPKLLVFIGILCSISCKTENKTSKKTETPELTVLEKVANAHGYQNWKKVDKIAYTFNVDRDSTHYERSWVWEPKENLVKAITSKDTVIYNRNNMDSIALKTNAGFTNDRYWLLAPFNLIWDSNNFKYTHAMDTVAPISREPSQKLTIVYGNEGGYTPGDAYDFYFGDDHLINEWVFRKANRTEASMTTTWENYTEQNGIKFALDHKKESENFNLFFSHVEVSPSN